MNNINIQCENKHNLTKYLTNVKNKQSVHSKAVPGKLFKFIYKFRFKYAGNHFIPLSLLSRRAIYLEM